MPTRLDEIQVFGPLPQFPRGFRSPATTWHTKRQGEQSDPIDTMFFHHSLDSRNEPVTAFLAVRGERFRLISLLFNAAIAIMTSSTSRGTITPTCASPICQAAPSAAGRDPGSGSPEPYAYESGFATRWVVQSQVKGDAQLNFDPGRGKVRAPLVLWGPYLWARGNSPRKLDGLVWTESDVRADRLHPNEDGTRKTTALLLNFFKTNEGTSRWFLKPGEKAQVTPLPE